jgi:nitrogen fixation protein NifU and related proteins
MAISPYSDKVIKHFQHPKNVGRLVKPDAKATLGSPLCGDMVSLYLKVDPKSHIIKDIKFESYGCASNIATGSIITELAKGKTIEKANELTWESASKELGGLPPVKVHCSVLAVDVLKAAIQDYEERHGLAKPSDVALNEGNVKKKLSHVINPHIGKDLIFTGTVKKFSVKSGNVGIWLSIKESDRFANNIREEINEALANLKGLKSVKITFSG